MNEQLARVAVPGAVLAACLFGVYLALTRPAMLYRVDLIGAAIFLQVVILALWKFRERFFPLMIVAFVWAGTSLPLSGSWNLGRWAVLAIGGIAGLVVYTRDHTHHFGILHLVALFAVLSAGVSALVSSHPEVATLKAGSLFLLFLYASTGGRLALISRELKFFSGLLTGCEFFVYLCAVCSFVLRFSLLGNPNSLGAVMGVVALPLLLWGFLVSQAPRMRQRRGFALVLALALLLSSFSRASIAAAAFASALLLISLRKYKLMIVGLSIALTCALLVRAMAPAEVSQGESIVSAFLYKGHEEGGTFASRRSVWDETVKSIRQHPWFGTGFGTSATSYESVATGSFASSTATTREHGNSYLAIAEWVGVLGMLPFFLMLLIIVFNIARVALWMRKTSDPFVSAVPMAAVLAAGLIHAAFEDWMFAVGYYLCVFFWIFAFAMFDVMPAITPVAAPMVLPKSARPWNNSIGTASPSR
jgi:O-antigen ligase